MSDSSKGRADATPRRERTGGDSQALALSRRLSELIARYDLAERDYRGIFKRCHSPDFKAGIANDRLSEAERDRLILERERLTGVDKASDRSDLAHAHVLAFADDLLKLSSTAPAMLSLKARACLWESSAEQMRQEGCVRAAEFLTQLAALS